MGEGLAMQTAENIHYTERNNLVETKPNKTEEQNVDRMKNIIRPPLHVFF